MPALPGQEVNPEEVPRFAEGADARHAAREFWRNAPTNPVPVPGRANPANPADMMQARLARSAENAKGITLPRLPPQITPPQGLGRQVANVVESTAPLRPIAGLGANVVNSRMVGNVAHNLVNQSTSPYRGKLMQMFPAVPGYANGKDSIDEETRRMNAKRLTPSTRPGTNDYISGASAEFLNGPPIYTQPDLRGPQDLPNAGLRSMAANYPNNNVIPPQYQADATTLRNKPSLSAPLVNSFNVGANDLLQRASRFAPKIVNRAADSFGVGVEALTPVPGLARAQRGGGQPQPGLSQGLADKSIVNPQVATPTRPNGQGLQDFVKSPSWADTGLRNDNSAQTLDWNESRFSNSGDPVQDAALEARRGVRANMRDQMDISGISDYQRLPSSENYMQSPFETDTLKLTRDQLNFDKEQANRPGQMKYEPAFNDEQAIDVPAKTAFQDLQRIRTMPKQAWEQFNIDLANENDATGIESRVQRFAKAAGISPDVIKYKLGMIQ